MPTSTDEHSPGRRAGAWAVHLLTASGAVWALLALLAVHRHAFREALSWLGLALVVDGLDGALARRFEVRRVLPEIEGGLLDNLVDYATYVLVPAFLIHESEVLPADGSLAATAAICLAAAFQFSHAKAKTSQHFRGFPSCWNVVALYLILLRPPPALALACTILLVAASLAPIRFAYPSRTRGGSLLASAWVLSLGALLWLYPAHPAWLVHVSLGYVAYYFLDGSWRALAPFRTGRPGSR